MADNIIASFLVALGFDDKTASASLGKVKKSVSDYERAVKDAEKAVEDAKWAGAKTTEEVAKLTRETNLRLAREALANAKDQEKKEQETAQKRKERTREFLAGMEKMALGAAAAATAIGYAVGKVTGAFDNLYFQAQRSGTSVQSLKALGYAFSQTGGTAQQAVAAVDSFTAALRNNPGLRQFVKDLGVDSNLQGADKLLATLEALKKEPYEVGVQHAGMLGISEDTFNQYVRQGDALRRYREEYDATARRVGLNSDLAAKAATSFQRTLTQLQATASALADKLLIQLAPGLEKVARGFSDWMEAHPEEIDRILKSISNAIIWLTEKLTSMVEWFAGSDGEAFMKRWENFEDRIGAISRAFGGLWDILKKIDSWLHLSTIYGLIDRIGSNILGGPSAFERSNGGGAGGGGGGGGGAGGDSGGTGGGTARIGKMARNANAQAIIGELRAAGYNANAIAAIVGSMQTESSFNPDAHNNVSGGHTGLWQWDRTRWPKIKNWIVGQGGDPRDARWQTRAWVAEHNAKPGDPLYDTGRTQRGGAILRNNPSLDDAIHGVRESERFGAGEEGGRAANARGWLPHVTAPSSAPKMTPGNFDPNNIDPKNLMQPAPGAASPTTNNTTNSRAVSQTITNNVNVQTAGDPRTASRMLEGTLGRVHSLALSNAQSAIV